MLDVIGIVIGVLIGILLAACGKTPHFLRHIPWRYVNLHTIPDPGVI